MSKRWRVTMGSSKSPDARTADPEVIDQIWMLGPWIHTFGANGDPVLLDVPPELAGALWDDDWRGDHDESRTMSSNTESGATGRVRS